MKEDKSKDYLEGWERYQRELDPRPTSRFVDPFEVNKRLHRDLSSYMMPPAEIQWEKKTMIGKKCLSETSIIELGEEVVEEAKRLILQEMLPYFTQDGVRYFITWFRKGDPRSNCIEISCRFEIETPVPKDRGRELW